MKRVFLSLIVILGAYLLPRIAFATSYGIGALINAFQEFTGYAGTGADGALTVSGVPNGPTNPLYTDDVRTYLTAASSAGATSLTVNSAAAFTVGNEVLIIQMLGAGTGRYETRTITSKTATSISFTGGLTYGYPAYSAGSTSTQVIKIPHYTQVTMNSGGYLTVHAFDGQTGGVMFFRASTGITINYNATLSGTISVTGKGYAGGAASTAGSGPGGGAVGSGGANTTSGAGPMQVTMGSGGGGATGAGGAGGGILIMKTTGTVTIDGNLSANGNNAGGTNGGGGAGGTMAITGDVITRTTTCGPTSVTGGAGNGTGTAGAMGRTFMRYKTTLNCTNAAPAGSVGFQKYIVR